MMQKRFEEAMPWFEKALQNDFKEAQSNIDIITAELKYEELKRNEIQEYLKRFE